MAIYGLPHGEGGKQGGRGGGLMRYRGREDQPGDQPFPESDI